MKRVAIAMCALALIAATKNEPWYDAYDRGVKAVNGKSYAVAVDALQNAIAQMPAETTTAKGPHAIFTYVPHFWLGIAKFNTGDVDGALREWKISEDQGVVARTDYYSRMKDWVARAQTEKQRNAEKAAAGPKNAANAALTRAISSQTAALTAGADRSDAYRNAQRKLQDAMTQFHGAGVDARAYQRAADTAAEAQNLFAAAAEEAKKKKAEAALIPPPPKKTTPPPVVVIDKPQVVVTNTAPPPPPPQQQPAVEVESKTLVDARIALQQYRRRLRDAHSSPFVQRAMREADAFERELDEDSAKRIGEQVAKRDAELTAELTKVVAVAPPPVVDNTRDSLESAYRAFAMGDLDRADAQLTTLIATKPVAEAYLLRGCTRYTRALLSRNPDLGDAERDFRAALNLNPRLRLDPRAFSPKLIEFFEKLIPLPRERVAR